MYNQNNVVDEGVLVFFTKILVNCMSLREFWIVMSYKLVIMFVAKHWSSERIGLTRIHLGKYLYTQEMISYFCFCGQNSSFGGE